MPVPVCVECFSLSVQREEEEEEEEPQLKLLTSRCTRAQ